jgi:hypothetical protein
MSHDPIQLMIKRTFMLHNPIQPMHFISHHPTQLTMRGIRIHVT